MPSQSFNNHLQPLLQDVTELIDAHRRLRTGQRGRQWRLGSVNRATLVMAVSCWEAYVEQVVIESVELLRPPNQPFGAWPALKASARSAIGRFNNPNADNVRVLFRDAIGLADVTSEWYWQNCDIQRAIGYLNDLLQRRHKIAHGVNPRPIVDNGYASWLPGFVRNLASCTDRALRQYLQNQYGLINVF